ncbi:RNA-binding protein lark-like isoform X5 [Homarus americanus]|uniref:RNA-binding protein lark-like isoform X5 n=1 Tax=Homarus americanus TaxID=6706 RepID=UPI001C458EE9|nr:RNA-binding protein lark-like isoform X5 [Homarus americanus]
MESDETLKEELDRVHQEIDQMSNEENQAAQNGVVLDEKERLQIRLAELEILYKNAQQELEATREALAKLQTNECMSTATGTETENNHPLESAASETSVKSQNTKVDFDIKQVSTQTPEWENTYKIFVGNLSNRASGSDIRKLFEAHGTVVEADVVRNYGFVHMENEEEGRVAIEALNGCSLHGKISTKKPVQRKTFKIFLGNLSHRATTAEIRQLFEAHGTVVEVDVLKSFGFVHMAKEEEGKAAIIALNGYILDERPMVVKASTGAKKGGNQRTKIYVGNLHKNTKLLELKRLFEMYGNVVEADIITNYAFVHMDDEAQAQRAIRELDGHEFHGLRLKVRKSTSHARQEAGIRNPDMYFPSGSSGNWFRQYPSDERIEASRYPDCERGGQSFGRKNDLYPPLLPPSYAREHMMHYRDDFDQYYDEGLYERHYGDHPTPPPPVLDNLYNRRLPPLPPHPDFLRYGRGLPPPSSPVYLNLHILQESTSSSSNAW